MTALVLLVVGGILVGGVVTAVTVWLETPRTDRLIDGALYGPRALYGPLTVRDPDESVTAVCGWDDPFTETRRQIAALRTTEAS